MALETGATAPEFSLVGTDGRPYSLRQARSAGPVLLVFFKTTCGACDLAFLYVNRLRASYGDGWSLWAVAQDPPETATEYAREHGIDYPVLPDYPEYAVSRLYDPAATPTFLLVEPDGRISYSTHGFSKDDLNELSRLIASRLNLPPQAVAPANDGQPAFKPG